MIKLGMVDFDTSHSVEFTRRLNHKGITEDQWVNGATVVLGCPGASKIMPERIPEYQKEMEQLGVALVDTPEEMLGKVDGILIESLEGTPHAERARPFLEAGVPCFIASSRSLRNSRGAPLGSASGTSTFWRLSSLPPSCSPPARRGSGSPPRPPPPHRRLHRGPRSGRVRR